MTNPILYVILNNGLNMSPGKSAAQAVHAAMMLKAKHRADFMSDYKRTVIVLGAKDRGQITSIADYLFEAKIDYEYYIDEGVNEVDAFSTTALAVEPIDSNDPKREIFAGLQLYGVYEEQDEDCGGNYCESEQSVVNRTVFDINRKLGNLSLVVSRALEEPPKPRWYERVFKRKEQKNGFVS